jgi:hypothetical protein
MGKAAISGIDRERSSNGSFIQPKRKMPAAVAAGISIFKPDNQ